MIYKDLLIKEKLSFI